MEEKISVIIPNYNGRDLLARNLLQVLKTCSKCQIIVVDDASTDGSGIFVSQNFPKIKLIQNSKNLGFAKSVNIGVQNSSGDLILLLNTDVLPRPNFLKAALKYFQNNQTFAVGLADYSHEDGKTIVRGRGGATFRKGFINHFALNPIRDETLWVSGGASLLDKQKFQELSGFDPIYAPFYWEDIDLSYRARKAGYICPFEPDAKVDHFHQEGAIKKHYSTFFIKIVSYKNQFLFVWKNISDYSLLIQHLLWMPYHFLKASATFDVAFFVGFFWAIIQIPQLIFSFPGSCRSKFFVSRHPERSEGSPTVQDKLREESRFFVFRSQNDKGHMSDKEVLKNFAKP